VALEIRQLIRAMSLANPLWGAPRIHGELLKIGIDVGQTSVAKYMARYRRPPSQGWKTFLRNHADGIASIDLFVVPTLSFRLLYGLLQLTEVCGWEWNPRYIVRDRDRVYGEFFTRRLRAMSIRPTLAMAEWTYGTADWLDPTGMS
jgi:hypothetical protein